MSEAEVKAIVDDWKEPKPLPMGAQEFEDWSDRIIKAAMVPVSPEGIDSLKFALGTMIMHLSPTSDHECDGYFIKSLRKAAINEVAHAKMTTIRDAAKARLLAEELAAKAKAEEVKGE
jgi:hypothetical protein